MDKDKIIEIQGEMIRVADEIIDWIMKNHSDNEHIMNLIDEYEEVENENTT